MANSAEQAINDCNDLGFLPIRCIVLPHIVHSLVYQSAGLPYSKHHRHFRSGRPWTTNRMNFWDNLLFLHFMLQSRILE